MRQYLVSYSPAAGGEAQEATVRGDATSTLLRGLREGTRYSLSVTALYASGAGDVLFGEGATLEGNYCPVAQKPLSLSVMAFKKLKPRNAQFFLLNGMCTEQTASSSER